MTTILTIKQYYTFTNRIRSTLDNIYVTNKQTMNNLLNYIDFTSICKDYNLTSGDLTPTQTHQLESIIEKFIKTNK